MKKLLYLYLGGVIAALLTALTADDAGSFPDSVAYAALWPVVLPYAFVARLIYVARFLGYV